MPLARRSGLACTRIEDLLAPLLETLVGDERLENLLPNTLSGERPRIRVAAGSRSLPSPAPSSADLLDPDVPGLECRTEDPIERRQRVLVVDERLQLGVLRLDHIIFEAVQLKER